MFHQMPPTRLRINISFYVYTFSPLDPNCLEISKLTKVLLQKFEHPIFK